MLQTRQRRVLNINFHIESDNEEQIEEECEIIIFNQPLQSIHSWKKDEKGFNFFLIKDAGLSFRRLLWIEEGLLLAKNAANKNKINKFKNQWQKSELDYGELMNFDPSWTEVDRILLCSDMFPIVHPKKANEMDGIFAQSLHNFVMTLINYENDNLCFGIHLLRLDKFLSEEITALGNYLDLSILLNRLYMDHYPSPSKFWREMGEMFESIEKFLPNQAHITRLVYIVRNLSVYLYYEWFELSYKKNQEVIALNKKYGDDSNFKKIRGDIEELFGKLSPENSFAQNLNLARTIINHFESILKDIDQFQPLSTLLDGLEREYTTKEGITENFQDIYNYLIECEKVLKTYLDDTEIKLKAMKRSGGFKVGEFDLSWAHISLPVDLSFITGDFIHLVEAPQRKFLVKWNNQSYDDLTWEDEESLLLYANKLSLFKLINRTLDKRSRDKLTQKLTALRKYNELSYKQTNTYKVKEMKEAKKQILEKRERGVPVVYNETNQPVFREGRHLRSYQLESLNWLIKAWKEKRNVILADEMGLGKTIQSMAFLNYLHSFERISGPFLVLAPLSTLQHWKRVFEDWSNLNCLCYYDTKGKEGRASCVQFEFYIWEVLMKGNFIHSNQYSKFNVLLSSFEVFMQDFVSIFTHLPFQYIIVDEAHRLKNKNAKILTSLKQLPCNRVLLLTGTPIQNNISELWSLLNYIEPKHFADEDGFLRRFGDIKSEKVLNELKSEIEPYLLRRLKEDVESSIPPLMEIIIEIELTQIQKILYKTLYEKNKGTLQKGVGLNYVSLMNNLEMQLRKCCDHPYLLPEMRDNSLPESITQERLLEALIFSSAKLSFLDKLLLRSKLKGQKALVFSQFTEMLKLLEEYLTLRGWPYEKIDGSTRARDRQTAIDRFNVNTNTFEVFLLSTKAGGLGINLTAANVVVIYDSDWNPQNDVQAIARAHRIGQTAQVSVFRLVAKNTYEAEMLERASRKLGLDQAIFLGNTFGTERDKLKEEDTYRKLKPDELDTLLRKGIIGLLESHQEAQTDAAAYDALDIDALIENAPKANYSLSNNGYTISKTNFIAEAASKIQIDDPDFWKKVLIEKESIAAQLGTELKVAKEQKLFKNLDFQKNFCLKLINNVHKYLEQRLKNEGFSADIEYELMRTLDQLIEDKELYMPLCDIITDIRNDFKRNSRRLRKIDLKAIENLVKKATEGGRKKIKRSPVAHDVDLSPKKFLKGTSTGVLAKRSLFPVRKTREEYKLHQKQHLSNDVFSEEDGNSRKRVKTKKDKIQENESCVLCGEGTPDFKCEGPCGASLHVACVEEKANSLEVNVNNLKQTEVCAFCQENINTCFKCGGKGALTFLNSHDLPCSLYKCSKCFRFYHLSCMDEAPSQLSTEEFICPSHFCSECKELSAELLTCIKCSNSWHKKCSRKKVKNLNNNNIICHGHQKTSARHSKIMPSIEKQLEVYQRYDIEPAKNFDYAQSKQVY